MSLKGGSFTDDSSLSDGASTDDNSCSAQTNSLVLSNRNTNADESNDCTSSSTSRTDYGSMTQGMSAGANLGVANIGRSMEATVGYSNMDESGVNNCRRGLSQTESGNDRSRGSEDRRCKTVAVTNSRATRLANEINNRRSKSSSSSKNFRFQADASRVKEKKIS